MKPVDREQRIEEIELALAGLFASPKAPTVHCYADGPGVAEAPANSPSDHCQ
jgi:hypothetical protein